MATFAFFYRREDLTAIAAEATNPGLTPQERQYGQRLWNGGLSDWANAPYAGDTYACVITPILPVVGPTHVVTQLPDGRYQVCDSDMRLIVISGSQVSKQQTIDWLRLIGNKYPGALYMLAIADDLELNAVEPWPVV